MRTQPTGHQLEQFQSALLDAFDHSTLNQMVRYNLNLDLEWITPVQGKRNLTEIVADLVHYFAAEKDGLKRLLSAALAYNSANERLRSLAEEWNDLEFEILLLPNSHPSIQTANRSVTISGDITKSAIVTGDGNTITQNVYNSSSPLSPIEARERQQLGILLDRVNQFWIEGVLEKSVHNIALIDLDKETQAEMVAHAWDQILELPDQSRQTIPPDKKISQIFEDVGQALLILGEPGSGKTITLLELARDLIKQAKDDKTFGHPIPVIFNLSSWTHQPLIDWLITELSAKYYIPSRIGRSWLENYRLLLLLDGLDEVQDSYQAACVESINQFRNEFGLSGLAVCSRPEEYTGLPIRLKLNGAIRLLPLTLEQIYDYLDIAGSKLEALRMALQTDENLQVLARSPLILGIMFVVYQEMSFDNLANPSPDTIDIYRAHLFDTYIEHMFKRKGQGDKSYTDAQTKNWLSWLAQKLSQHDQSIFLIEQLQPSWLPTRTSTWTYLCISRLIVGAIIGLIIGSLIGFQIGLIVGLIGGLYVSYIEAIQTENIDKNRSRVKASFGWNSVINIFHITFGVSLALWLVVGLIVDPFAGLVLGFGFGAVFGVTFGLRNNQQGLEDDIHTVEVLSWHWIRSLKYGGFGLLLGLIFGLIGELTYRITFNVEVFSRPDEWLGTELIVGAIGTLSGVIFGGLRTSVVETKVTPNQGIRLSLRNGIFSGLMSGLIIGIFGILFGSYFSRLLYQLSGGLIVLNEGLLGGLTYGVVSGLLVALWYGGLDIIQHYTLRCILYFQGNIPWNYAKFLDYASEHIFLQKVGGSYIFIHRLLLKHFASMSRIYDKQS